MVWSKFRQCEQNFQECDQHLDGVNKIMTVWSWKLMVWTNFFRCDQMLMVWWNDISVWTNVHFLEIVWSHRMVWCLHMFFPEARRHWLLVKLDDTGLSVSYLSPLFHTLSVQFLIPLSLSLFTSSFLAPSDSLPPFFLSVSTLRVRPESVKT